jgi:hypothetical protein
MTRRSWVEKLGPASRLQIEVKEPVVVHTVTIRQVEQWLASASNTPADAFRKAKLKQLLDE